MNDAIVARVTEIAERVATGEGIEIVEITFAGGGKNRVLRITIDKPQGVSHADCEFISQNVGTVLDVEDVIPGSGYRLEVTSPGVERKLLRLRDFERSLGKRARVVLREPFEGRRDWEGILAAVAGETITLDSGGQPVRFTTSQIARANLKFDW